MAYNHDIKEKEKNQQLMLCSALENVFTRYNEIEDPVIRSMLFLDKFFIALDIFDAYLVGLEVHADVRVKARDVSKMLKEQVRNLSDIVTESTYAPDHKSLGQRIMQKAKQNFESAVNLRSEQKQCD
jgi:hypothetical protein